MCYPRAGPCESEATSGGIPGSDTSITSKITWRIIGLLKDIVNSLKSNKIGCRLQSCWIRRRITSLSDVQRSSNTRLTCWRKYSLIPGNNPQMKRLLKVHNSRSYEEKVCLLEDPCILCGHQFITVYDERLVTQIQSEYLNNKIVSWRNQLHSIENQFKVIDCKSCSNCKISTFISPSHLKHTIIAKYSRTCLKGSFACSNYGAGIYILYILALRLFCLGKKSTKNA